MTFTQQIVTFPDFWKNLWQKRHKIADFCPSSFVVSSLFLWAQIIMQILWWLEPLQQHYKIYYSLLLPYWQWRSANYRNFTLWRLDWCPLSELIVDLDIFVLTHYKEAQDRIDIMKTGKFVRHILKLLVVWTFFATESSRASLFLGKVKIKLTWNLNTEKGS